MATWSVLSTLLVLLLSTAYYGDLPVWVRVRGTEYEYDFNGNRLAMGQVSGAYFLIFSHSSAYFLLTFLEK